MTSIGNHGEVGAVVGDIVVYVQVSLFSHVGGTAEDDV